MKQIRYWLVDYLHLLRGLAGMHVYHQPPSHYLGYTLAGKYPVILIPGLTEKWGFLKPLGDKISLAGHPVYIIPKLKYNLLDIPASAKIISDVIDNYKLDHVIIVAHSKGGLIGKYLLIHSHANNHIKALLAIATPFSGSPLAKIIPHRSFRELSETSPIVTDLKSNQAVNTRIISLYPIFDNHIPPPGSYLKGAQNIPVNVKGHHKILFDPTAQNKVLEILGQLSH